MIVAVPYATERRTDWDSFVERSRNGTFLFNRDYMEYHANRFEDRSLMFLVDEALLALFPATHHGTELVSHGGLTYGGLITGTRTRAAMTLELMETLVGWARDAGYERLVYKCVPHIYHRMPAEEDLYALFRLGAKLYRRDLATALVPHNRAPYTKGRKWSVKRGHNSGVVVRRSDHFAGFMNIEATLLKEKYGAVPVHTADELERLARLFPDNIKLFGAYSADSLLAGVIVYESAQVAHAQYIASTPEGRELSALDAVLDHLISVEYSGKAYFDFGISTEQAGQYLNLGLAENKESYGARSIVYDFYELDLRE